MKILRYMAVSIALCATVSAQPPADYPLTVDSQASTVPTLEVYQGEQRTFLVTFKDGTNVSDVSSATVFMGWSSNWLSATPSFATSHWAKVNTGTGGQVRFTFLAQDIAPSITSQYRDVQYRVGAGVTYKLGTMRVLKNFGYSGNPTTNFVMATNLAGITFLNAPWVEAVSFNESTSNNVVKSGTGLTVTFKTNYSASGGGSTSTLYRVSSASALLTVANEYGPSNVLTLSSDVATGGQWNAAVAGASNLAVAVSNQLLAASNALSAVDATALATNLTSGTIFGADVVGTWSNLQIQASTVASSNIIDATIATADLADDAVNGDKIAADSILSTHISDGEIENADIGASAAIAQSKIAGLTSLAEVVTSATGTLATVVASDALKLAASHTNTADWATNYLPRTGGAMTGETVFSNAVKIVSRTSGTYGNIEQSGAFGGSLQVVVAVVGSNSATGPRNVGFIQNGQIGSGFSDQTGTNTLSIGGAFGAMQSGIVRARYGETKMVIANGGDGAMQRGYLDAESNAYAYATNSGRGSIGIFNIAASSGTVSGQLITGHASIGLGAVRVTNDSAIVVGDGNVSHGNKSITADSFWGSLHGDGSGITGDVAATSLAGQPYFALSVSVRGVTNTIDGNLNVDIGSVNETGTLAQVISRGGSLAASALTNIPAQSITGAIPAAVITASTIATGTPVYAAITQLQAGALGGVVVSNSGAIGYVSATNQGIGWSGVAATQTVNMAGNAVTNLNRIGLVGQTNLVPIRGDLFASNGIVYFVGSSGSASAQYGENNLTIGNYQTIASAQAAATNYARWLGNSPPTSNTANGSHMEVRMNQTNVFIYNVASGKWFRITGTMEWP